MDGRPRWKPTHHIESADAAWIVMLHEGKYYTRGIWAEGGEPEWIADEDGQPRYVARGGNPQEVTIAQIPPRPHYVRSEAELSDPQLARIRQVAVRFRKALEEVGCDSCAPNMAHFPRDCCHHATNLLALYFFERTDLGVFDQVCGEYYTQEHCTQEHCWLKHEDIVVDVTADQFDEGLPPVVVTRHSDWHAAWEAESEPPPDGHQAWLEKLKDRYRTLYARLVDMVEAVR